MTDTMTNFRVMALTDSELRSQAPSIFASGPSDGVSKRYIFVPTARIVEGLRQQGWVPVSVEEQTIRLQYRRGFQKHLLRLRLAEQMRTLSEWNVEMVVVNSHDGGCAYQLHAGLFRRVCSNGLVIADSSFEAIRFRHAGLDPDHVVQASFRVIDFMPKVAAQVGRFRDTALGSDESFRFARRALLLRYPTVAAAPVDPETLLRPRRTEDEGRDLWTTFNRVQENLIRGGLSDSHRDRRGKLRSIRCLRGIDSKVSLNKGLWGLAERLADGDPLLDDETITATA